MAGFAGRHHAPSSHGDSIVTVADRWASGMDRGASDHDPGSDYWRRQVLPARLRPILGSVGDREPPEAYLPLRPLTAGPEAICHRSPERPDPEVSRREYETHWEAFVAEVERIGSPAGLSLAARIEAFLPTFAAVYEKYAWCVPAATDDLLADISLFDHSRAVAGLAAALWRELGPEEEGVLRRSEAEVRDPDAERFSLLVGDLSGIQGFLYAIPSKRAAKLLRGRSFYLQLLTEAVARALLRRLGLPPTNLVYAGGGKFWILAHASAEEAARAFADEADQSLLEAHGTAPSFSLGAARARGADFLEKRVAALWQRALADAASRRRRRLRGLARRDPAALFDPFGEGGDEARCDACGAPTGAAARDAEDRCPACAVQEDLGLRLPRAKWLLVEDLAEGAATSFGPATDGPGTLLLGDPLAVRFELVLEEDLPAPRPGAPGSLALRLDGTEFLRKPADGRPLGFWMIARNRPLRGGDPHETATYEDFAREAEGAPLLGVLRLDVDNLGAVFSPTSQGGLLSDERSSLSRVAAISRQLSYFFGGLVGWLVGPEADPEGARGLDHRVQVVYSGGDDAFLVGAWSAVLELAAEIRARFGEFACNPELGLSGGIALVDPHHPIANAAALAGELEAAAKGHRRLSGREKDALALIEADAVVSWQELEVARAIVEALRDGIEGSAASRALVFRLQEVAEAWQRTAPPPGPARLAAVCSGLERGRWAWMAAYALPRALRPEARKGELAWITRAESWLADCEAPVGSPPARGERPILSYLHLIARWAELATRSRGDER